MPLTPADVRNKQFSTTRLRPGYDEEEVDAFLDEVEAELDRLIQQLRWSENAEAGRSAACDAFSKEDVTQSRGTKGNALSGKKNPRVSGSKRWIV